MKGFGPRALILLAVAAAATVAAPAEAEVYRRTTPDGTVHYSNVQYGNIQPSPRRMALTAATPRASRQPSLDYRGAYSREIAEAAARYAVPERLISAVIRAESGFDCRAVSRTGARGLMQLMPETAAMLGVRDSFDPRENIHGGTRHLRGLLERFRNNLHLALAAYNAGDKAVVAFGGIPPYPETREYVARVLRFYGSPIEWGPLGGSGIHQVVERDGTVLYTNIPIRRVSAVSRGR